MVRKSKIYFQTDVLKGRPGEFSQFQIRSDQSLSRVWLFATPWIAARQTSLSIANSWSSLRLTSIESVMPSSRLILCRPLLLLPPSPPSIRVFSNESTLRMRWPKYWSFSLSIIPSKEHPELISFIMDWLDLPLLSNFICFHLFVDMKCKIKFNNFKVYGLVAFSTFTVLYNHHICLIPTYFSLTKKTLYPLGSNSSFLCVPQTLTDNWLSADLLTGEPGGLPSMGSHRVGHDWSDLAAAVAVAAVSYQWNDTVCDYYGSNDCTLFWDFFDVDSF